MVNQAFLRTTTGDPANRHPEDFYVTPPVATRALLAVEKFSGTVWEPACGDGSMSRVLEAAKLKVRSSDLHDRGYGTPGVNFLEPTSKFKDVTNVITNPPFKLAQAFAERALAVTTKKVALLCRLTWLESAGRARFFSETPLARVWVFSYRIAIHRATYDGPRAPSGLGGTVAYAWFVWDHKHVGEPTVGWLAAPKES